MDSAIQQISRSTDHKSVPFSIQVGVAAFSTIHHLRHQIAEHPLRPDDADQASGFLVVHDRHPIDIVLVHQFSHGHRRLVRRDP